MLTKLFAPLAVKIFGGLALLLLVLLGVQTARLGIRTGQRDNYKLASETLKKSYIAAQAAAEAEQKAYYASISARYRARAVTSETDHAKTLEGSQRATDRFIADNRFVRPKAGGTLGGSGAGAQGGDPAIPDDAAPETELVAVKPEDVHACAADYAYAQSAYELAQGLIVDGLAVPLSDAAPDPSFAVPVN